MAELPNSAQTFCGGKVIPKCHSLCENLSQIHLQSDFYKCLIAFKVEMVQAKNTTVNVGLS